MNRIFLVLKLQSSDTVVFDKFYVRLFPTVCQWTAEARKHQQSSSCFNLSSTCLNNFTYVDFQRELTEKEDRHGAKLEPLPWNTYFSRDAGPWANCQP